MILPAVLVPSMVAGYAAAPDLGEDVHVVALGPVEIFAGSSSECNALLDEWSEACAAAWRAMMSPVLAGWSEVA